MNQLRAKLIHIEAVESLYLLTFELDKELIYMLSLELSPNLQIGKVVTLAIKSTSIAIAKEFTGVLSYLNQLNAEVVSVNNGKILSSIVLNIEGFELESLITLKASLAMDLKIDDEVTVLISGSEVSVCG